MPTRQISAGLGPSEPQQLFDTRLNQLRLEYWTKVPTTDEFAAKAISVYSEMDFAIIGWFDMDLFLTDLIAHRQNHCSAFLVSAFLCIACVSIALAIVMRFFDLQSSIASIRRHKSSGLAIQFCLPERREIILATRSPFHVSHSSCRSHYSLVGCWWTWGRPSFSRCGGRRSRYG